MLIAYASFRAPLAMLELPLFMVVPDLYSSRFGLSLTAIGLVLLVVRAVDAVADPLLGRWMSARQSQGSLISFLLLGSPVLAIGFGALLLPETLTETPSLLWLGFASMVCYLAYSWVSIAYQALGSSLSQSTVLANRISNAREIFGLLGVVLALGFVATKSHLLAVAVFAGLLLCTGWWLRAVFPPKKVSRAQEERSRNPLRIHEVLKTPGFSVLLTVFMLNGVASAITATLLQFFVRDYLGDESNFAIYLLIFFASGLVGLPCWLMLANRFGQLQPLLAAMLLTASVFSLVFFVGRAQPGLHWLFALICLGTGFTLAADLMLPSAALARLIDTNGLRGSNDANFFGLWNLATKMNLALAAGIALPLAAWLGYEPKAGNSAASSAALLWVYGALPIALKLLACGFLARRLGDFDFLNAKARMTT